MLFTCIESYLNSLILPNMIYKVNSKRSSKGFYTSDEIQRNLSFGCKLKFIYNAYNKNFYNSHKNDYNKIISLKKIRDEIVHTKNDSTGDNATLIFKELLNIKFDDYLLSTRVLLNFFKKDYIVDCQCEKDY